MSLLRPSSLALGLACLSSLAAAAHIEVTVGKDSKLEFNPPSIKAEIGDTITYKFFSKNHAVAQSTFADPCQLQENGIFSGFTPNASPDTAAPTDFTITVNDTKPLWFYCPQTNGNHCQSGMVHAVNPPETGNTFDAYKAKAQQAATPSTPPVGTLPVGGLRKLHIDVGFNGQLMFNPNNVTELVGTVVEFSYNPANHSIVQSSFDKPCQPIERDGGGFVAPFVPTKQAPSGVTFEVTLTNPDPIWFYCAQTTKSHCQSGMLGSINAATEGDKTFQAFKDLAATAPPSTIGPETPLVGALKLNGTFIANVGGNVLDITTLDPALGGQIPQPGMNYPPYIGGMAGGNQPANYNWGDNITDEAVAVLRALQYIDNFIVALLLEGFNLLSQGQWSEAYPNSIKQTIGSLVAQSLIHRRTYTDTLQHFGKDVVPVCDKYDLATALTDVDTWLGTVLTGLHLSIGATLDALSAVGASDPWATPALATGIGSQARMSALVNLMQNHVAAAAPREVLLPTSLATSYVAAHYATDSSCAPPSADGKAKAIAKLVIKDKTLQPDTNRVKEITVEIPEDKKGDGLFIAWLGPWGGLKYTSVDGISGKAAVPDSLSGHVWAVMTSKSDVAAADIDTVAVAGPEIMWVSQQWSVTDL
ncbi:hypothetical protein F5B22DRAFT_576404 [Xylaria bambusicola]|uniref:uncharacterized protein n=1 Tax=Xylaria bambusicola TaxID=326684 RepID=UPI0020081A6B|nr:uncharacterized protein F5B22DRAFT_576404 [Xylaria bambusicola]KAI0503064.1 hypothetical protein F5B22DRAFT_576404 [Xylaria bambusicola]